MLSSISDAAKPHPGEVGVLHSYHYSKGLDIRALAAASPSKPTAFLDSGGFSALTTGAKITIGEFEVFARRFGQFFQDIAVLDEIGDPVRTHLNFLVLRDRGIPVLPCVHFGTSPEWVSKYVDAGERRILLGGMVPHLLYSTRKDSPLCQWVDECFSRAPGVSFHGFGLTTLSIMQDFPWGSSDSASLYAACKWRNPCRVYDPVNRKIVNINLNIKADIFNSGDLFEFYGTRVVDIIAQRGIRQAIYRACGWSQLLMQRDLGFRVFFAGSPNDFYKMERLLWA